MLEGAYSFCFLIIHLTVVLNIAVRVCMAHLLTCQMLIIQLNLLKYNLNDY